MKKIQQTLLAFLLSAGFAAQAETIVVNTTSPSGPGSFKQAIIDANASPGLTNINFLSISTTDPDIFNVSTNLPAITQPVEIWSGKNKAVLKNNGIVNLSIGLQFAAGSNGSKVYGLSIENFIFGVQIFSQNTRFEAGSYYNSDINFKLESGSSGATIINNYITVTSTTGYAVTGSSSSLGLYNNQISGGTVNVTGDNNTVGGTTAPNIGNNIKNSTFGAPGIYLNGQHNKIIANWVSNHTGEGIFAVGSDVTIEQNLITEVQKNSIRVEASNFNIKNNTVTVVNNSGVYSGIAVNSPNDVASYITGNTVTGSNIYLNNTRTVTISGNTVSYDPAGNSAHGGIQLENSINNRIESNQILYNGGNGVLLNSGSNNNLVLKNKIYENGRAGVIVISASQNKISKNEIYNNHADAGGGKSGIALVNANANKPAPVISSVQIVGTQIVITGNNAYVTDTVELFISDAVSASNGLTRNATKYVTNKQTPDGNFVISVNAADFNLSNLYFVVTATDANKNTSLFSNAVKTTAPLWNASTAYQGNTVVSWNGNFYRANWWSLGADPTTHSGPYQEWTFLSSGARVAGVVTSSIVPSVNVYPNPTKGAFTIVAEANSSATITNSFGNTVAAIDLSEGKNEVNLSLAAGIYFVKIGDSVTKLIVE